MIRKSLWLWIKICIMAAVRLSHGKYAYQASALAFTTLLALVPMVSVIVSVITIFPIFGKFIALSQNYIFANFIPTSGHIIQNYLEGFVQQATKLPMISILFLLFTAVTLIVTVEHSLNDIWQAAKRKSKWSIFFLYWLILLLLPMFIGVSIFISTYLFSLPWLVTAQKTLFFLPFLSFLPLIINTLMFGLLYTVVPNAQVRWRNGLIGGLIAAVLFDLAKFGFAFYFKQFNTYELIYGTLSIIPIFLLWIYISWLIILYGALVVNTSYRFMKKPQRKR